VKNNHEIHFEKKEIMILFLAVGFLTNGITVMFGMFLILLVIYRIINRNPKQESTEFLNTNFVN